MPFVQFRNVTVKYWCFASGVTDCSQLGVLGLLFCKYNCFVSNYWYYLFLW